MRRKVIATESPQNSYDIELKIAAKLHEKKKELRDTRRECNVFLSRFGRLNLKTNFKVNRNLYNLMKGYSYRLHGLYPVQT